MDLPQSLTPARIEALTRLVVHGPDPRTRTGTAAFTGEPTAAVPLSTPADVVVAFDAARRAQRSWARRPVAERVRVLRRVQRLALQRREQLIDVIQWEAGKARLHAFEEVVDVSINAGYYARSADRLLGPKPARGWVPGISAVTVEHHPRGVVGLITPWNYPLTLPISDALPALVAGNAVVLKPDHQTPFTALAGVELLHDAGLPEGLLQVVIGEGPVLGPTVIEHADVVAFTGGTATGRTVAEQAGARLVPVSLELGGKNAQLVLADADLRRAVPGTIRSVFANAGQLCVSMERIYVEDAIYDRYVPALVEAVRQMRVGASYDYDIDMGSLISLTQLERVQGQVEDALSKGATALVGGKPRPDLGPSFFDPTLLVDVDDSMTLCREETFGPVASIYRVRDAEEAVARANDSRYGLSACIWTRDTRRGRAIASRLRSGTVSINEPYGAFWGSIDAPMGGMGWSGMGRRHGREGLLKYTDAQTVGVQRLLPFAPSFGMDQRRFSQLMTHGVDLLNRLGRP